RTWFQPVARTTSFRLKPRKVRLDETGCNPCAFIAPRRSPVRARLAPLKEHLLVGVILSDLANRHPQLIYLRATKLSRELRYPASEPPSMDSDGAMNVGQEVALLAGLCSAMTAQRSCRTAASTGLQSQYGVVARHQAGSTPVALRAGKLDKTCDSRGHRTLCPKQDEDRAARRVRR